MAKLDPTSSYSKIDQFAIRNDDYAFAYPALATNGQNEAGIALGGGGKTFNANSAVGILGDLVVWYPELSDASTTRWGNYATARQASPQSNLFAGFGYAILKDSTSTAGVKFHPFYILFGRDSIINPKGREATTCADDGGGVCISCRRAGDPHRTVETRELATAAARFARVSF